MHEVKKLNKREFEVTDFELFDDQDHELIHTHSESRRTLSSSKAGDNGEFIRLKLE